MIQWVVGLVISLFAVGYLGYLRISEISKFINNSEVDSGKLVVSLLTSVFSVGAPIWFSWIATKQIGQRFRLAEDYAFKASVSRAYEGYRREAARVDPDLETQLLASALARLDELPLRLVDAGAHGSPMHELLDSDVIKQAARAVPGFRDRVKDLALEALQTLSTKQNRSSSVRPAPSSPATDVVE